MKTMKSNESPIDFLRRMVHIFDYETDDLLQDITTVKGIFRYFELWSIYDTDFAEGIIESIEQGAPAKPYNDFVKHYDLPWAMYINNEWIENKQKGK